MRRCCAWLVFCALITCSEGLQAARLSSNLISCSQIFLKRWSSMNPDLCFYSFRFVFLGNEYPSGLSGMFGASSPGLLCVTARLLPSEAGRLHKCGFSILEVGQYELSVKPPSSVPGHLYNERDRHAALAMTKIGAPCESHLCW